MTAAKSPFPGMDPYLEAHWGDVHSRLVTYSSDALQEQLPKDLRARCEERVFVDSSERRRTISPDVRVVERRSTQPAESEDDAGGTAVATETAVGTAVDVFVIPIHEDEPATERFIEIREAGGGKVVTVIEFLSPANKRPGPGRELYLRKQEELYAGHVNSVEVDLLRSGERITAAPVEQLPHSLRTPYHVCVRRAHSPLQYEVYPITLLQKLPSIRIPLREGEPDVTLDLQRLLERCYAGGRYDDLDYTRDPDPPLTPDENTWAVEVLHTAGRRVAS